MSELVGAWVGWAKTKLLVEQATSSTDDPTPSAFPDHWRSLVKPAQQLAERAAGSGGGGWGVGSRRQRRSQKEA